MRREELFSRNGYYAFLLESNALLHREAVAGAGEAVGALLQRIPTHDTVNVLDLACGGMPVAIANVMASYPQRQFDYAGIDINPDQVALARTFDFPPNVSPIRIIEGNAWDLGELFEHERFELIFSGMNLHHGVPEELRYLGLQLRRYLADGGIFVSHDVYRPDSDAYLRRPDINPDNPTESFRLVDDAALARAGIHYPARSATTAERDPAWRADYLQRMHQLLLARGGETRGTEETIAHMRQRDYPVSTAQLRDIFAEFGLETQILRWPESEPMAPYVAMCVASRAS